MELRTEKPRGESRPNLLNSTATPTRRIRLFAALRRQGTLWIVKELSKRLEGYYIVTRVLLEQINSSLVSGQTFSVGDNFDPYEI